MVNRRCSDRLRGAARARSLRTLPPQHARGHAVDADQRSEGAGEAEDVGDAKAADGHLSGISRSRRRSIRIRIRGSINVGISISISSEAKHVGDANAADGHISGSSSRSRVVEEVEVYVEVSKSEGISIRINSRRRNK